ncbi:DUF4271 domain-containing protein [Flavobacterium sp.]|jgi:hypothetical protein|uniref:DUF4271 domain-containing protein n=1 Tax=Flavobacterium sp. TaxID=239 RepID=UPI002A835FA0|nr:DUF4271 domain-containing protein [Flavobacterium sp.]
MEINYQERILNYTDWATLLFVISVFIIALNRSVFQIRFIEFMRLGVSDKYTKIYKDSSNMNSGFTMSMFLVQLISFSFFILLTLSHYKYSTKENFIVFIQIITFLGVFILSKYLIEKIIATTFKIEEFVDQFNLLKVSYRTYFGVLLLPISIILYYNSFNENWIYLSLLLILIAINVITYFITLKLYQNVILGKIFYFILYLCTLEIAPYYFMYKWIIKN